jgi:hypothetical protein
MTANILQFLPRSNQKADRAFWKGGLEQMAAEILSDEAFKPADTAPSEYCAPDGDYA